MSIKPQGDHGNRSANTIPNLTYTPDATSNLPPSLFLKIAQIDPDSEDPFDDSD